MTHNQKQPLYIATALTLFIFVEPIVDLLESAVYFLINLVGWCMNTYPVKKYSTKTLLMDGPIELYNDDYTIDHPLTSTLSTRTPNTSDNVILSIDSFDKIINECNED